MFKAVLIGEFGNFLEEINKFKSENGGASSKSELVKYLEEGTKTIKIRFWSIALVEN